MSELAAEKCADCGRPFGHPSTYRLVNGRAVCRARKWCQERQSRKFAKHAIVRVKGDGEEQRALYGRDVIGAVGEVLSPARRSQGVNRYLVRMAEHDYVSPKRRQVSHIEAFDIVLREDHIEAVTVPAENEAAAEAQAAVRTCRGCGCTDEWSCDNGCWWVEADLCSNCVGAPAVVENEVAHYAS